MLTVIAAAALAFSPVPDGIPNIAFWTRVAGSELRQSAEGERKFPAADKYARMAAVCPEAGPCAWTLRFEDRRNRFVYNGRETWGFGMRFVLSHADGRQAECLAYYDVDRGFFAWSRKNSRWLREEPGTEEYEFLMDVGKELSAFGDAVMRLNPELGTHR